MTTTTPQLPPSARPTNVPDYSAARAGDGASGYITQTVALFVDAYRELNSRKLFWITLILSLVVVGAFAFVGINERGVTIFGRLFPGAWNSNIIPPGQFYRMLFTQIAIPWWLGFFALALALVSVASIFPDMLTGGSIDLYLAKPISRLRLFLTKYVTGLLFVALQVFVFSVASFLVIGIRGGTWEFGIFLAVPLVTLLFSYIFCVCAFLGLLTRSTLASMLLTILLWCVLMLINGADAGLLFVKVAQETEQAQLAQAVTFYQRLLDEQNAKPPGERNAGLVYNYDFQRKGYEKQRQEQLATVQQLRFWHGLILWFKAPLPKTGETIQLMDRWLVDQQPFMNAGAESKRSRDKRREERLAKSRPAPTTSTTTTAPAEPKLEPIRVDDDDPEIAQRFQSEITGRAAVKLIGSSLAFEAVVLTLAAWIFCRRDY